MVKELWPGGPCFKEESGVFRIGADSVLLANFADGARIKKKKRAIDLGCGSGIISVLLALSNPELHIDGIELQPRAARLASENVELCGLAGRINIIEGDLRRHREFLYSGAYDFTVSNPPYNPLGSGKRTANADLAAARDDELCTLGDLCRTARYLTRRGGSFFLVNKPERLSEILRALSINSFEPKRIRFVHHKRSSPSNLVLIESRHGGNPSLKVEAPLILLNDDNGDTDEIKSIYKRGGTE